MPSASPSDVASSGEAHGAVVHLAEGFAGETHLRLPIATRVEHGDLHGDRRADRQPGSAAHDGGQIDAAGDMLVCRQKAQRRRRRGRDSARLQIAPRQRIRFDMPAAAPERQRVRVRLDRRRALGEIYALRYADRRRPRGRAGAAPQAHRESRSPRGSSRASARRRRRKLKVTASGRRGPCHAKAAGSGTGSRNPSGRRAGRERCRRRSWRTRFIRDDAPSA